MTLKPNYLRAVALTYLWICACTASAMLINYAIYRPVGFSDWPSLLLIGGICMAVVVCVMFVPRELRYDSQGFACRMLVQGAVELPWEKLESYGAGHNVFVLKFEGRQGLQISGLGFRRSEWKAFQNFLKTTFPERKRRFWFPK